jgi:hypothetical protein
MIDEKKLAHGLKVLRNVLLRLRSKEQGGFTSYMGNGKWSFVSTGLPQTSPEELNVLLDLAGIVPEKVVPRGSCETCVYSRNGRERGYEQPCLTCLRPLMSNFELAIPKPVKES